jgi:hypothetical protein
MPLNWRASTNACFGRRSLFRAPNGMAGLARTPVVPEATPVRALSAQLRRPRTRSATSAQRRLLPSGERKYRSWPPEFPLPTQPTANAILETTSR